MGSVSLIVLPWSIWLLIRKRDSTDRLLYAGFFVMIISSTMDKIGISLKLWVYYINPFPLMTDYIPYDMCALPVATMRP